MQEIKQVSKGLSRKHQHSREQFLPLGQDGFLVMKNLLCCLPMNHNWMIDQKTDDEWTGQHSVHSFYLENMGRKWRFFEKVNQITIEEFKSLQKKRCSGGWPSLNC
jgi:hypothetical protein